MKQNLKKKIVIGLAIVGVGVLIMWVVLFAPQKELVVTMNELPRLDGSEGTSIAYSIYYIWDGKQEKQPWWVIFQAPLKDGGFEWVVLEVVGVGDWYNTDRFMEAIQSASKFDKNWFNNEMHSVQRTRLEKLQYILFESDTLEKEKEAIEQVTNSINLIK